MRTKRRGANGNIRYSEAFKRDIVRELEMKDLSYLEVRRKYRIGGASTVPKWVRKYGNGTRGKVIRVIKANEVDEASRLRKELRQMKEAVADLHVELALERAFLSAACEQLKQPVDGFKKKHDGVRRGK